MLKKFLVAIALTLALTSNAYAAPQFAVTGSDGVLPASATNPLPVTSTALIPGTGATSLGKAEDGAHTTGDTGVAAWGVRNDSLATTYCADQDYSPMAVGSKGQQYCELVIGGAVISATNTVPVRLSADGTNPVDATHGVYADLLQSNAVISATNPLFTNISVGSAAVSTTNPVPVAPNGVAQASIVNVTAAIANVDTTIAFGVTVTHAIIKTDSGASNIFVDLANGTATTADFKIDGGGAVTYTGAGITGFHYIGSSASGNISYLAW